jgi:hypothetical protein
VKKQQNNSTHGWALLVALAIALLSISAVLLAAASFKAAPAAGGLAGPSSSIPSLPNVAAPFTFNTSRSLGPRRVPYYTKV